MVKITKETIWTDKNGREHTTREITEISNEEYSSHLTRGYYSSYPVNIKEALDAYQDLLDSEIWN